MDLTERQFRSLFDARTWERGVSYARQGRVSRVRHEADGNITASVRGSGGKTYSQTISPIGDGRGLSGRCNCPVGINCKHVAAVCHDVAAQHTESFMKDDTAILSADRPKPTLPQELPTLVSQWLGMLRHAKAQGDDDPEDWPATVRDRLLYILDENVRSGLTVETMKTSVLKSGGYAKARRYDTSRLTSIDCPKFIRPQDLRILGRIRILGVTAHTGYYYPATTVPAAEELVSLIDMIVRTGRGRWKNPEGPVLFMGSERRAQFFWDMQADGRQTLVLKDKQEKLIHPLAIDPPMFIDTQTGEMGPLVTNTPASMLSVLLKAPAIAPEDIVAVAQGVFEIGIADIPEPSMIAAETRQGRAPIPCLKLLVTKATRHDSYGWNTKAVRLPTIRLSFDYNGHVVEGRSGDKERFVEGGKVITFLRDQQAEERAHSRLEDAGAKYAVDMMETLPRNARDEDLYFSDPDDEEFDDFGDPDIDAPQVAVLQFMATVVPRLKAEGWRIDTSSDWPFSFYEGGVEIRGAAMPQKRTADNDWFSFGLNLLADGHKVDLVPTILQLLTQLDFIDCDDEDWEDAVGAVLDGMKLYPQLGDGRYVALDAPLLIPLLRVFLTASGLLDGFHRAEAGRVHDVIDALDGCGVAFDGAAELLALGRRLQALALTADVEPPASFHGALRPYQAMGYGWLCALGETGFGGVLADDMGLGKTIQTLAFLARRLLPKDAPKTPALLVVPTSLVHTWRRQAALFVPDLKVLALHGPGRQKDVMIIDDHHVVITTYALLHRDLGILASRQWDVVILDEAQAVKNPASGVARAIRGLNARMRLALTGTPMENSLMDLWSLYDWLVPGLLGDRKNFRSRFVIPIEKQGDSRAQAALNVRIRPFMLRRTKQQVAIDLPEKTEITELVPLGKQQGWLYEAVRLAMDERVRKTIAEKGLAASHITILDALLKLRQICCDPTLLKHDDVKAVTESAKRERLIELLSDLVAEGRRVLVFSQFVEMLDLIEADVQTQGWAYARLTGRTVNRDEIVEGFQNGDVPIFLISLKSGGTGLTLTAADTVILYDPWWNPAVERQAMDRVHRIGQDRKVFVYRLIAEGSVEQAICGMQERKQAVADALFDGGESNPFMLGEAELEALFRPLQE